MTEERNHFEAEKEFFQIKGYQKSTADFTAFLIEQAGDGAHDISITSEYMQASYSFTNFSEMGIFSSKETPDALCLALEHSYGSIYYERTVPAWLSINSYGKKLDGTIDPMKATLRAYEISRHTIIPYSAAQSHSMYGSILDAGEFEYADAWLYTGIENGNLRNIVLDH